MDTIDQSVSPFKRRHSKNFAGLPATVPDPRFGEIRELNNAGWSNYDGLVTSFRWRMTANLWVGSPTPGATRSIPAPTPAWSRSML